ncbi:hypothetical protein [Arthrobacter woluwensis]|uniref:hypothetical protein n=1 Tax=Arthrobacter woluwensis TaxID=156980 RepID=UPI0011A988F8|nr:hypothetical protein [Arthrobacter woluwensis]
MERIITTLGRDISYASIEDVEYALHVEEGLGLADPGLSVDGDASALAERAERERRVRALMLAACRMKPSVPALCVVCHWPGEECTCNVEVCS